VAKQRDSLQGSLDLLVSRRRRLHGYAMSAIQGMSGDVLRVEEGSLYPALHRMEAAGWIRAEWITKENGRRARVYELTLAGNKRLGLEASGRQTVTAAGKPRSARGLIMALWSRIRNVFRGDHLNGEIDEELESHIQEAIEQGRDPVEARRAFGSALRHREGSRDDRRTLDSRIDRRTKAFQQPYGCVA
jgi:PadR family transcriptional regulator, regulatory protein PadR